MTTLEYDRGRAMKQTDFKPCACCGKGVMHNGSICFYRVTVEPFGVDIRAVRRQIGLQEMLGGSRAADAIAHAMGPNDDIGIPLDDLKRALVCMDCATKPQVVALLCEGD